MIRRQSHGFFVLKLEWRLINIRIWHEQLIPKLCQKHLCAMWREGLGAYKIITENKKGYRNHPAVKEFKNAPIQLLYRLWKVRNEMIKRGYKPKELPDLPIDFGIHFGIFDEVKEWQPLDEQIKILKAKKCNCKV